MKKRFAALLLCLLISAPQPVRALDLEVVTADGYSDMDFGILESGSESSSARNSTMRQVRLIVTNPTGRPYTISQLIPENPKNELGMPCPVDAMTYYVTILRGEGTVRVPNRAPVEQGEKEIFISRIQGDAAEILITYELRVPQGQSAGKYRTLFSYRLKS